MFRLREMWGFDFKGFGFNSFQDISGFLKLITPLVEALSVSRLQINGLSRLAFRCFRVSGSGLRSIRAKVFFCG